MKRQYVVTLDIPENADDGSIEDGIYWREFLSSLIHQGCKTADADEKAGVFGVNWHVVAYDDRTPFQRLTKQLQEELADWCEEGIRNMAMQDPLEMVDLVLQTYTQEDIDNELHEMESFKAETAKELAEEAELDRRKEEGDDPEVIEPEDQDPGDVEGNYDEREQP